MLIVHHGLSRHLVMATKEREQADLVVIGAGLAGLASTLFAVRRGLKTVLVGANAGGMLFASGLLDLLGIIPAYNKKIWEDPWEAVRVVCRDWPEHPYARLGAETVKTAWDEFVDGLRLSGLHYRTHPGRNLFVLTSVGTSKVTCAVPETMWPGVIALEGRVPVLIVGFQGAREFSARQILEVQGQRWPGMKIHQISFPYPFAGPERHTVAMAEAMEHTEVRQALVRAIHPQLADAQCVGMPAILGVRRPAAVVADLERRLGVPVFEIPTAPPSVPGLRLREALEEVAGRGGAKLLIGTRAVGFIRSRRSCIAVTVAGAMEEARLEARGFILAGGRFLGRGLVATRSGVKEPLLDLPVYQPRRRSEWHRDRFLDPGGHPLNKAGLVVDEHMRPLNSDGCVAYGNLFAAGSVLAHQDWIRMRCGAGLAIATAYGAVRSFVSCC